MSVTPPAAGLVAPPAPARAARRPGRSRIRYTLTVLASLLPRAIPLTMFVLVPSVSAARVSLTKWTLLAPPVFVGLDNYTKLLSDPKTGDIFLHTLYYIVGYLPLVYL